MSKITIIDGMAIPRPGIHKCGECGIPTNYYLLWADGRATWPGCTNCRKTIEEHIAQNGKWACIIGWKKYD